MFLSGLLEEQNNIFSACGFENKHKLNECCRTSKTHLQSTERLIRRASSASEMKEKGRFKRCPWSSESPLVDCYELFQLAPVLSFKFDFKYKSKAPGDPYNAVMWP